MKNGVLMRDDRSRIGDFGSVNDAFPGGVLADEILTPGDKQVRALFVTGGNPLITMPNAGRLRRAFEELELLVVLDVLPHRDRVARALRAAVHVAVRSARICRSSSR